MIDVLSGFNDRLSSVYQSLRESALVRSRTTTSESIAAFSALLNRAVPTTEKEVLVANLISALSAGYEEKFYDYLVETQKPHYVLLMNVGMIASKLKVSGAVVIRWDSRHSIFVVSMVDGASETAHVDEFSHPKTAYMPPIAPTRYFSEKTGGRRQEKQEPRRDRGGRSDRDRKDARQQNRRDSVIKPMTPAQVNSVLREMAAKHPEPAVPIGLGAIAQPIAQQTTHPLANLPAETKEVLSERAEVAPVASAIDKGFLREVSRDDILNLISEDIAAREQRPQSVRDMLDHADWAADETADGQ